ADLARLVARRFRRANRRRVERYERYERYAEARRTDDRTSQGTQ
ncbi:glucokinase, partial [Streptomyces sp. SID10116]|nr:glucokinase [Streptomyces sp. SID10116]